MNIKIYVGLTTKEGQVIDSNKAIQDILEIVPFEGYTILQAKGVYRKKLEDSIVIEYYTDNTTIMPVLVAIKLREHFNQECVMLIADDKTYFV